ncbi:MAG: hypothetical protein JXR97_16490 [Planctomycetes bacterium]|nr:hypothetical protein [Planctomycetota bacterium]
MKLKFLIMFVAIYAGLLSGLFAEDAGNNLDSRQPLKFTALDATKDADGDFLVDSFEQELINTYAPFLIFHPQETSWPSNVNHHLNKSLRVRMYDKTKTAKEEYSGGKSSARPRNWSELIAYCDANCTGTSERPEDVYLSLPVDKTALVPGEPLPDCADGDFRIERAATSSTKTVTDVYKARVMVPMARPVQLLVSMIDDDGKIYKGECVLNVFAGGEQIPDEISSEKFAITDGDKSLTAKLTVKKGLRKGLGLVADPDEMAMPDGPVVDWSQTEVEVKVSNSTLAAKFIPQHKSMRGDWLENGKKKSAYFSPGKVMDLAYDVDSIKRVWGSTIPKPEGDSEIYAHVYPVSSFIVVQYWMFYGYSDFNKERHEGDWGDRIDVVLYRDDPILDGEPVANGPAGVIPAYREGKALTQKMIAMIVYSGSCGQYVFYRPADNPDKLVQSRSVSDAIRSLTLVDKMQWIDKQGSFSEAGTHPVAYVAKGSHQMYPKGGSHKRVPAFGRVNGLSTNLKKWIDTATAAEHGTDECAKSQTSSNPTGTKACVTVLPHTGGMFFSGEASYGGSNNSVTLSGKSVAMRIVNVGELTASRRQKLMRYDGVIYKELKRTWGQFFPRMTDAEKAQHDAMYAAMKTVLETPIKEAIAKIDAESGTGTNKKSLKLKIDEKVETVRSKIWQKVLSAKDEARKVDPQALDDALNDMVLEVIREVVGVREAKQMLLLGDNKPMAGGEFIDYPGRWGRLSYTSSLNDLTRQQNKHFLEYDIPDDDRIKLLRSWSGCGPVGPAGGRPQLYLADFYRDYDTVGEVLMVYGLDISL